MLNARNFKLASSVKPDDACCAICHDRDERCASGYTDMGERDGWLIGTTVCGRCVEFFSDATPEIRSGLYGIVYSLLSMMLVHVSIINDESEQAALDESDGQKGAILCWSEKDECLSLVLGSKEPVKRKLNS